MRAFLRAASACRARRSEPPLRVRAPCTVHRLALVLCRCHGRARPGKPRHFSLKFRRCRDGACLRAFLRASPACARSHPSPPAPTSSFACLRAQIPPCAAFVQCALQPGFDRLSRRPPRPEASAAAAPPQQLERERVDRQRKSILLRCNLAAEEHSTSLQLAAHLMPPRWRPHEAAARGRGLQAPT